MATENVGAGILNIITESLYDKPIVVFREYAQNSADSFEKIKQLFLDKNDEFLLKSLESHFWLKNNDLFFLDNGKGIESNEFKKQMETIARSNKKKSTNIGYKGIGRLSGISYCQKLEFINICSRTKSEYQRYSIDCQYFNQLKNSSEYNQLSFDELISKIGSFQEKNSFQNKKDIDEILTPYDHLFTKTDTGFLVIMREINLVLERAIQDIDFLNDISWLLPVTFKQELLEDENLGDLFKELSTETEMNIIPAKCYNFFFNNTKIERPISIKALRTYTCKFDLTYAIGIINFNSEKISILKGNVFSGIRIYIDNVLLCDETELLPILRNLGLINHTVNELIQSVRGIGSMIYITDKVSISANARRTFIEMTDSDSMEFLGLLAEYIKKIYTARYALSEYNSYKTKYEADSELSKDQLKTLKIIANDSLAELSKEKIDFEEPEEPSSENFTLNEKKQLIKKKITKKSNDDIKKYLNLISETTNLDTPYDDYMKWLIGNYSKQSKKLIN
jgi:hypothetical protein